MASRIKIIINKTGISSLSPFVYSDDTAEEKAGAWTTRTRTCNPVQVKTYPKIAIYDPKYDGIEYLKEFKDVIPIAEKAWRNHQQHT